MTVGGAERVALDLAGGLSDQGYDVDLVLVEATGDLLKEVPQEVTVVNLESTRVAMSLLPLRRYITAREPDILYSIMTEPNLVAIAANGMAHANTTLVISEHNMLSLSTDSIKDRFISFGAWVSYLYTDHAVAVSEGVRQDLLDQTRILESKVTKIYNPVRVESIAVKASEPSDHRWLNDDSLEVVLAGGRHEPQKGFDNLIESFTHIQRDNARLIIFGKGPETARLKQQANELGISDRVSFVGFIENPFSYMSDADVFVLSSKHEGFGLVLIEAMASGCPIVSTDCESGPAEILEGGKYGSLVPVGDIKVLAEKIRETLETDQNTEKLKRRALDFSIDVAIEKYDSLFTGLRQ